MSPDATNTTDAEKQLRAVLSREAHAAADEALADNGRVPASRWVKTSRLSHLTKVLEAESDSRTAKVWVVVLLLALLIGVSLLLFKRVSTTEIELDLRLAGIEFVIGPPVGTREQPLTDAITGLGTLSFAGVHRAQVLAEGMPDALTLRAEEGSSSAVEVSRGAGTNGRVSLGPLWLPEGARVQISTLPYSPGLRILMRAPNGRIPVISADIAGSVLLRSPMLESSAGGTLAMYLRSPDRIELQSDSGDVECTLMFEPGARGELWPHIPVRGIDFGEIRQVMDRSFIRPTSTILAGSLYMDSLNGQQITVRPGDTLRLDAFAGEMRSLKWEAAGLQANLHGTVAGISAGTDSHPRDLMPTWLEWLRARQSLTLLWATSLYLFTLSVAVLRWWGVKL